MTNNTKLKIDLQQGTLDVEGNERFVREIYNEFKERLKDRKGKPDKRSKGATNGSKDPAKPNKPSQPMVVKDLDLKPEGKTSLKGLYRSFKKLTRTEKILLYVVYLQEYLGIKRISADHVYTCMKEVGDKVPATLRQILSNSKNKTGWFTIENGIINYTRRGKTYFDEELRKKLKD